MSSQLRVPHMRRLYRANNTGIQYHLRTAARAAERDRHTQELRAVADVDHPACQHAM